MMSLRVVKVRCEYRENPTGLDVRKPRFGWAIESEERNIVQAAYRLQVASEEGFEKEMVWDTGRVESDASQHIEYAGGLLAERTRYYFRIKVWDRQGNESDWCETAFWETAFFSPDAWEAQWITADREEITGKVLPSSLFRRTLAIDRKVQEARAYVTARGLYHFHINGRKVGEDQLAPGWTSYNKRLQYQTYDVTSCLQQGDNALGLMLGGGWYLGNLAWEHKQCIYGDRKAVLLQLHIRFEDGSEQVIVTDSRWKTAKGPVLSSQIYHGETYDARLETTGWDTAAFDDQSWDEAEVIFFNKENLVAQEGPAVRKIQEIKPVSLFRTPAGETVLDMGQNMVGWVRFTVSGEAGDRIVLKHAEVLDRDGNFYTANLRSAKQQIEYILKGGGPETYEPFFTFQGFRYVMVDEYPGDPALDKFTGVVVHSGMEQTGDFRCSEPLINQLQHNILWGQKGNFVDVPTDCPQRDERLGWTGDAQVFIRTACFNMNVAAFFTKWLRDLAADQREDGGVPFVIPHVLDDNSYSSAAWGDAAVICPWTLYLSYGDRRILEEQYDSMKAWVEYIRHQGENEYLWNTGFHFGDWLGLDARENSYIGATDKDFIATAFYAYSAQLLVKTASVLGKTEDVRKYGVLYAKVLEAFRKEFITPAGRLVSPTQTAHVLALMFDLVEEKDIRRTLDTLIRYLEENNWHLTTGFVGTPYLCLSLTKYGRSDIAYKLLLQDDYPSWLYQVQKGATTIWEHWDGIKPDGSFWSADMNSFNHYAYGSIGEWLYRIVAGLEIDPEKPGYKHFIVKPQPGGGLTSAQAQISTGYGKVSSSWKLEQGWMEMTVEVPHNTTADAYLPWARLAEVTEDGKTLSEAAGVHSSQEQEGGVCLTLGSGSYRFRYRMENRHE